MGILDKEMKRMKADEKFMRLVESFKLLGEFAYDLSGESLTLEFINGTYYIDIRNLMANEHYNTSNFKDLIDELATDGLIVIVDGSEDIINQKGVLL